VVPMSVHKKRCRICREWFTPDVRTARFQKTCSAASCRQERKQQADHQWRANNPDYDASRQGKKRAWAHAYPDYWRKYRFTHPTYAERNRVKTRERKKASRLRFANQDAIGRDPVGYLEGLRPAGMFANQDAIARPIDGILTFLVRREVFANHDAIGQTAPIAG
jgi:hypothetical protein